MLISYLTQVLTNLRSADTSPPAELEHSFHDFVYGFMDRAETTAWLTMNMHCKIKRTGLLAAVLLISAVSAAVAQPCASIKDDRERLACHDSFRGPTSPPRGPSVTSPLGSVDQRRAYADSLERQFLSSGTSADVFVREDFMPVTLIIAGYFTKASAYRLFTQSKIMLEAKQAGFGRVTFQNIGPEGSYVFDLIGGLPLCDSTARLCR